MPCMLNCSLILEAYSQLDLLGVVKMWFIKGFRQNPQGLFKFFLLIGSALSLSHYPNFSGSLKNEFPSCDILHPATCLAACGFSVRKL